MTQQRRLLTITEVDTYLTQKEREYIQQNIENGQIVDHHSHMHTYEQNLKSMGTMEKLDLYKAAQQDEQETAFYESFYLDEFRFFNMPNAIANFDHNLSRITWTKEEAVALCLGKNPELVNFSILTEYIRDNIDDPEVQYSAFINHYFNIRGILLSDASIADRGQPLLFLNWFNENKIIIHAGLKERVIKRKILSIEAYQWIDQEIESALSDNVTDIDEILSYKIPLPKGTRQTIIHQESMHLRTIAALLEFIEGVTEGIPAHPSIKNHTTLVELLAEKYGGSKVEGFSRRTLMSLFRLAKTQLKY